MAKNVRDVGRTTKGYAQARKQLKKLAPDVVLVKGGFVGVPIGLAAASLKIPFLTHDSDSIPGLANRIISKWAKLHATGMPAELYEYEKSKTVYTGVPVSDNYEHVSKEKQEDYKNKVGVGDCKLTLSIIGGSQGGSQLNDDVLSLAGRLMQQYKDLGILHIVGPAHEEAMKKAYKQELLADEYRRVVVKGFVNDAYLYTGAGDVVVSRAGASVIAELAIQGKAVVLVPGQLAGDHQSKNAKVLTNAGQTRMAAYGDAEGLYKELLDLLSDEAKRSTLAKKLNELAKPNAARELAELTLKLAGIGK